MNFDGPLLNQRWRLGPRMGSGSQARTYLARDEQAPAASSGKKGERVVVLKQMRLDKKSGWKSFDLFEREVRVLKSLRHPGIPRYIDSFESEPGVYNLVMEKMPGATLRAIATKVRFSDDELRDILARVLEILDYIHRHDPPVIHRDIKPANLLRDAQGKVALVDFGGVRDALRESGGSTIVGTFGYMAPEQLHGQATPATDLYALGATIVALAGRVEPEEVPRKGLRMELSKHLAGRDAELVAILQALTEPDPDHRPQSARDAAKLLGSRAERASVAMSAISPVPSGPSKLPTRSPDQELSPRPFDDLGDMLEGLPGPLQLVLRISLLGFAVGGYVGVAITQAVVLPLLFALIGAFTGDKARPKLASTRTDIHEALQQGKEGFRNLRQRCLPASRRRRNELPRPKSE